MDLIDRQEELGLKILHQCRNELCELLPYLDGAFACLPYRSRKEKGFATDGAFFYYSPAELLETYSRSPQQVKHTYLHMLLHCLYLHLFRPADAAPDIWNLACDMAVEQLIAQEVPELMFVEKSESVKAPPNLTIAEPSAQLVVKPAWKEKIREYLAVLGPQPLSAERIAAILTEQQISGKLEEMQAAFFFDDHSLWKNTPPALVRKRWEQALGYTGQHRQGRGKRRGSVSSMQEEELSPAERAKTDYKKYLQRFTVSREELELDEESFDYIYYHLGMENYGSMPLIEPLEYKEVHRLEELVIAIDTSGSCSREVVSRFLAETYDLLARQENFFRKMNVYFVQCDCVIQDVEHIRSREDWLRYMRRVKIHGRGGTDFRPVFELVKKLRKEKKLKKLKALLYFTDGDGIYPTAPPDFETVFVLLENSGRPDLLPPWAKKLFIHIPKA